MFRRRLLPLLSISALLVTAALYASGAFAASVGGGVTFCAKGTSISYSSGGTCKASETPLVVATNGDTQALENAVGAALQQQATGLTAVETNLNAKITQGDQGLNDKFNLLREENENLERRCKS